MRKSQSTDRCTFKEGTIFLLSDMLACIVFVNGGTQCERICGKDAHMPGGSGRHKLSAKQFGTLSPNP